MLPHRARGATEYSDEYMRIIYYGLVEVESLWSDMLDSAFRHHQQNIK